MNRQIEFRYWDGEKMISVGGISFFEDGTLMINDELILGKKENLMQFTGLFDKNGKEIYEGDIVKYIQGQDMGNSGKNCSESKEKIEIKFEKGAFNVPEEGEWIHNDFDFPTNNWIKEIEVIGNIYENK